MRGGRLRLIGEWEDVGAVLRRTGVVHTLVCARRPPRATTASTKVYAAELVEVATGYCCTPAACGDDLDEMTYETTNEAAYKVVCAVAANATRALACETRLRTRSGHRCCCCCSRTRSGRRCRCSRFRTRSGRRCCICGCSCTRSGRRTVVAVAIAHALAAAAAAVALASYALRPPLSLRVSANLSISVVGLRVHVFRKARWL